MSSHFSFILKPKLLKFLKNIIIILFLGITSFSYSQIYEVGVSAGKSIFIGDIGETNFINIRTPNIHNDYVYGLNFKWNRSARHSYRFSYIKGEIAAKDLSSEDPRRQERGYNLNSPINEYMIGLEFNFFEFDLHKYENLFTPYIMSGVIYSTYNEQKLMNNDLQMQLQKDSTFGIPMILGLKYRFRNNLIIFAEGGARYTFTDNIDGNNYNDELINYNFGNLNNNDWYIFYKLGITYTFGRNPCYCNIGK